MGKREKMVEYLISEVEFLGKEFEEIIISLLGDNWKEIISDDENNEIFYKNISDVTLEISQWYGN